MQIGYLINGSPYDVASGAALKLQTILSQTARVQDCTVFALSEEEPGRFEARLRRSLPCLRSVKAFHVATGLRLRLKQMRCLIEGWPAFVARGETELGETHVVAAIQRAGVDVLHIDGIALAPFAERIRDVPVVVSITDAVSRSAVLCGLWEKEASRRIYYQIQALLIQRLERRLLAKATITHVVSPVDAEYLRGLCEEPQIRTIGLAVSNSVLQECDRGGEPNAPNRVVMVGKFGNRHFHEATRTIIESLAPQLRRLGGTLTLIGRGRQNSSLGALKSTQTSSYVTMFRPWLRPCAERT